MGCRSLDETSAVLLLARDHHALANRRMTHERGFDLAGLDPIAAHFHLVIGSAEIFDVPVGEITGQVAGPVQAPTGRAAERVAEKFFRGQFRSAPVTARHPGAADIKLAGHADRHRFESAVEQVNFRIGDRPADGRPAVLRAPGERRVGRRLGRTVEIVDLVDTVIDKSAAPVRSATARRRD